MFPDQLQCRCESGRVDDVKVYGLEEGTLDGEEVGEEGEEVYLGGEDAERDGC